ncbi:MAG: GntR family transcriptional regulator [Treponema sp.]|jgi:DNA-binding GntR family transcriptional regulator|nr:GntR family transcriptional regulator [Treponema sp.]
MSKESLKRKVYNGILERIIRKQYPADTILNEKELSEQFGVSKAPVREALIELNQEDIVRCIPRAGYQIVQFTETDIWEATELRRILELAMLDKIIAQITPTQTANLYANIEETHRDRTDTSITLDAWWSNNIRFHLALNAVARNSLLTSTLEKVILRLWRAIAQLFWDQNPGNYMGFRYDTHRTLLKAIESKDKPLAEKILIDDISSIEERLRS